MDLTTDVDGCARPVVVKSSPGRYVGVLCDGLSSSHGCSDSHAYYVLLLPLLLLLLLRTTPPPITFSYYVRTVRILLLFAREAWHGAQAQPVRTYIRTHVRTYVWKNCVAARAPVSQLWITRAKHAGFVAWYVAIIAASCRRRLGASRLR